MAKPYREPHGSGWAFRLRVAGEEIYLSGFETEALARREMTTLRARLKTPGQPAHRGPYKTTLGEALIHYGLERLPGLKGAEQEVRRINRYLRLAGLCTLRVMPVDGQTPGVTDRSVVYWRVELEKPQAQRHVPNGLHEHRAAQAERGARADALRLRLVRQEVAKITAHDIQRLIDTWVEEGLSASTVHLELAVLRQLFNHAVRTWRWKLEAGNPAEKRKLPVIDNARDRVLTNKEWQAICEALKRKRNPYVGHALALLLESAMRCSEALLQATWADFDEEACLLRLRQAKAGKRLVPLTPGAMSVMRALLAHALDQGPVHPDMKVFRLSYEALSASWNRACEVAGVEGVMLHDLRHTSATRFALELNGNIPVLKLITGHKTDSQLMRYVNINPADVSRLLHGRPLDHDNAPAGLRVIRDDGLRVLPGSPELPVGNLPANVVPLRRRQQQATP